mmetsp:Transcript_791/g.1901  ORF Transcript_791/g.1901 Transcript_791/m.1901 type:complete len:265 (-) Transcript_791:1581-2375(-)
MDDKNRPSRSCFVSLIPKGSPKPSGSFQKAKADKRFQVNHFTSGTTFACGLCAESRYSVLFGSIKSCCRASSAFAGSSSPSSIRTRFDFSVSTRSLTDMSANLRSSAVRAVADLPFPKRCAFLCTGYDGIARGGVSPPGVCGRAALFWFDWRDRRYDGDLDVEVSGVLGDVGGVLGPCLPAAVFRGGVRGCFDLGNFLVAPISSKNANTSGASSLSESEDSKSRFGGADITDRSSEESSSLSPSKSLSKRADKELSKFTELAEA